MDANTEPQAGANGEGNPRPSIQEFVSERRLDCVIFLLRLSTIIHGILAVVPLLLTHSNAYQRCLVSYIGVSAFRLSQRVTGMALNMECFQQILSEDSGHYLFYCFFFALQTPSGIAFLVPVMLFSMLHSGTFLKKLHEATHVVPAPVLNLSAKLMASQQQLLMAVANTEIMLMPMCILAVFGGTLPLFAPFIYYRFLTMRYLSRRNPYSKLAFSNMRMVAAYYSAHPSCPAIVSRIVQKVVGFIQRLAPAEAAAAAQ